jgi:hypothetical protein
MDMGGVDGPGGIHPSILPTEPTDGAAALAGSADHLADGENSLFDKGLIDTA